jgi:hypothetical protein
MSIKRTIITAIVGLTLVAVVAPAGASAVTVADLMAQIAALQAQLQSLGGTTTTGGNAPAACSGVSFSRNLTVGSTGSDVKCLQVLLNNNGYKVATTGAGSPGAETTYFGGKTLVAVKAFQVSKGFTPANQVGPMTRGALNALLGTTTGGSTGGVITPTGAGLTAMLASDNPASGTLVTSQGLAKLAKFTFVNGDNAEVKITNLKLNRIGVSADTDLVNVYLMQGATRLTDAASVSSGLITFNDPTGLFTVPAGSSTTITVASDMSASAGITVGVALNSASSVTSNASSVRGNFPLNGNLMSTASGTLAGVQFAAAASVTPTTNSSLNPQNNYPVWQDTVTVSTRAVNLTRIAFREIGSAYATDLQNFRLNVDGNSVGSAVQSIDKNGYVTFDLSSSPLSMTATGHTIKLMADIVNGSSRTFYFSIRVAADANFVDSQYGASILPTLASGSFPLAATSNGVQTISSGTLTVAKTTTSPSGNVVNTASNALLASYTLTAAGEPIKITDLYVRAIFTNVATGSGNDCSGSSAVCTDAAKMKLRNGAIYANGVQIGSTTDLTPAAAGTHFSLGSSLVVTPGSPVTLEVRADMFDNIGTYNDVDATDTIQAEIVHSTTVAQDMISLGTPTTTGVVDGNTMTVAQGGLSLSKYTAYTNQTVVPPVTNFKLGHFTLTSSATEATNLNTIYADLTTNTTVVSNLYVKYGTGGNYTSTTPIATPSATTLANSWSINQNLAAGQTIDVIVYGDVSSLATTSVYTSVKVTGITASSATAVNTGAVLAGQTVAFGTGSINAVVDGTTPANQAVSGNQQVTAAKFRFTASNDNYTITETKFVITGVTDSDATKSADSGVINSLILKDGSTVLATVPFDSTNGYFNITGLNVPVSANTTKVLTADLSLANPYTDGTVVTVGKNIQISLAYIKTLNGSGVMHDAGDDPSVSSSDATITAASTASSVTIAGTTTGTTAGNYMYVYKSVPTFTVGSVTGQSSALSSGSQTTLYTFTVAAPASGPVALRQLKFPITINDVNTTAVARLGTFRFFRGSTELTQNSGPVSIVNASGTDLTSTTSITTSGTAVVVFYPEEVIPAGSSMTYTLKATSSGFSTSSTNGADSVTSYLASDTTPANVAAGVDTSRAYLASAGNANTAVQALAATAGQTSGSAANVVWSDYSGTSHDYTDSSAGSADWFNGYLIQNLPLDTIGISAQ